MEPFQSAASVYLRWRHSRGFGVHSPFAYSIVKGVVNPGNGYAFYGYADIDNCMSRPGFKGYPRLRHDARLLLRLMVFLRTRRLLHHCDTSVLFPVVAHCVAAGYMPLSKKEAAGAAPGDMLLVRGAMKDPGEISRRLAAGTPVMILDPSQKVAETVRCFHDRGLLLVGKRILIAIPNPDMAFVRYDMNL